MGTRMSDGQLRRLFARLGVDAARRGPSCLDTEDLVAYVGQRLGEPERANLESHLGDCAFCLGQLRFALRSEELGPPPAVPRRLLEAVRGKPIGTGRRLRRPAMGWLAAAAGVMFAVVALRFAALGPLPEAAGPRTPAADPPGPAVRALPDRDLGTSAPSVVQPAAGESVERASLTISWRPVAEAFGYTVQVMDGRGDLLWEGRTEALSTTIPATLELPPGEEFYVWVTAELRSGLEVRSSATAFRIASK